MRSKKPEHLTDDYKLDSLDEGCLRSIYVDLSRKTGVYGGPQTAFEAVMIFLAFNGYEVKRPPKDQGDSKS